MTHECGTLLRDELLRIQFSNSHGFAISPRVFRARFALYVLKKTEGAGNAGRSMRPQPRVQKRVESTRAVVTTVTPEITRHSPRNGFNKLLRALPGEPGLFATVACGYRFRRLDTSVGMSGPHDFAVRFKHLRLRHHPRPPHPAPRP
jgi:hypothetical protein